MSINKRTIGEELKRKTLLKVSAKNIGNWAHMVLFQSNSDLDTELEEVIKTLLLMEEGPEFELMESELHALADRLIAEGEKEELGEPISEIKERAMELDESWLMCPLCQEAWETHSEYGIVRCPKCQQKLHNPRYKNEK